MLEIFLAVVAIGGFWLVREAAISRARDTAKETSESIAEQAAKEWLDDNAQPLVHRSVLALVQKPSDSDPEASEELANLAVALGGEDGDEEPNDVG